MKQNIWQNSESHRVAFSLKLQCLKKQISNRNFFKTVTNTKTCQLGKFPKILSSLQKWSFENSATKISKISNWKFWQNSFFRIFTKLKINFWKTFSQSFATKSPDIWFWILPFYAMRLRYFRTVLENHIALLFQRSYSKITSRCYFTEVTRNHIALLFHRSTRNHLALLFHRSIWRLFNAHVPAICLISIPELFRGRKHWGMTIWHLAPLLHLGH